MSLNIALSSYTGYGAWFLLRLLREGHNVDYYLSKPDYANILGGIIPAPKLVNGREYPRYDKYDVSLFDLTGRERQAEYSAGLCPTLGDGAFNCELENNRNFGIEIMEECGIDVPPYEKFSDTNSAKAFIRKTGKRYVFKPDSGLNNKATTYVSRGPDDMLKYIDKLHALTKHGNFILQEYIKGTEISIEGWFNGEEFYLINATLEEKKFMNENLGPNTECSGNLVFIFGNAEPRIYRHGLMKMKKFLKAINYTGMIDLNTIATPSGLYGLEWTPRLGYDASAALVNLYAGNFGEMLFRIGIGERPEQSWRAEYCAGTRLSIPPYPSEINGKHPAGVGIEGIDEEDFDRTFMYDVELQKNKMVTAGHSGFICTPMGVGNSIGEAFYNCEKLMDKIEIPDCQMRTDIDKSVMKRYDQLDRDGWLS